MRPRVSNTCSHKESAASMQGSQVGDDHGLCVVIRDMPTTLKIGEVRHDACPNNGAGAINVIQVLVISVVEFYVMYNIHVRNTVELPSDPKVLLQYFFPAAGPKRCRGVFFVLSYLQYSYANQLIIWHTYCNDTVVLIRVFVFFVYLLRYALASHQGLSCCLLQHLAQAKAKTDLHGSSF